MIGNFQKVQGGYAQRVTDKIILFVPEMAASDYDPDSGKVTMHAPDYDALEAAKTPAVHADKPGVYAYCYEMQKAPTGCDFSAELGFYGKHYFLRPMRDDLPRLKGRGITYDESRNTYQVTIRAYDKLKTQYKISREYYLD